MRLPGNEVMLHELIRIDSLQHAVDAAIMRMQFELPAFPPPLTGLLEPRWPANWWTPAIFLLGGSLRPGKSRSLSYASTECRQDYSFVPRRVTLG